MLQSPNLVAWWVWDIAALTPEMTPLASSGHLQIDLMSADSKCGYAKITQPICKMLTVLEGPVQVLLIRPSHVVIDLGSSILKMVSKCVTSPNWCSHNFGKRWQQSLVDQNSTDSFTCIKLDRLYRPCSLTMLLTGRCVSLYV